MITIILLGALAYKDVQDNRRPPSLTEGKDMQSDSVKLWSIISTFLGLKFLKDMSDQEFLSYLKSEGMRDRDCTILMGK